MTYENKYILRVDNLEELIAEVRKDILTVLDDLNCELATKDEIYQQCDIITLHTDLNPTSKFLLNKETFEKMKKTPFIINTSRGQLIREKDLVDALNKNIISGIGIDVYENEPLAVNSPLRSMSNVIASCHNSNSSPQCWDRVHKNSLEMIEKGLK